MVDFNLISDLDEEQSDLTREVTAMLDATESELQLDEVISAKEEAFRAGSILKGRIVGRAGDDVVIDVGLKSEGLVPAAEWDDPSSLDPGDEVQVWLDSVESDTGHIVLSKRKADRVINWHKIVDSKQEGDDVEGRVMRKIKGGLLVDIGYPVFLPASQVDIRRPGDIGAFIGKDVRARILKIDTERRNIVISRRKLIDEERLAAKEALMSNIEVGQSRKGAVKNIADFGAFVDLGGIDGLLHITDMSWDRVGHPSELLRIDDEIEIKVLSIDRDKEKIALGLKQLKANPWDEVEARYPVGQHFEGEVVNIMNYGAFIKLEPGVEGLVHISEMSWTRRINHPSEIFSVGDMARVVVLEVNKDKHEISLGVKQTLENPWEHVATKYPPDTRVSGRVRNLTNYGAFVEIEEGIDGLLHVSDMSWTKKINHPSEILKKGSEVECVVLKVEEKKQRIALGLKQLHEDPWERAVIENYIPGQIVEGTVTKITNFGAFVELEDDLEGLLHVSELADHKVEDPHEEVKIGDTLLVKILRVDAIERKIGLSKKRAEWSADQEAESAASEKSAKKLRGGLHGAGEETIGKIQSLPGSRRGATKPKVTPPNDESQAPEKEASLPEASTPPVPATDSGADTPAAAPETAEPNPAGPQSTGEVGTGGGESAESSVDASDGASNSTNSDAETGGA